MTSHGRGDPDPRDIQIQQLQEALDSRVVIEQAKGILAERFGLTMSDAFALLRLAARSHQLKIRALAIQIADTRATPIAIADALVKFCHPDSNQFEKRALRAEQAFANLNDALLTAHRATTWSKFVCEFSNPLCTETITLSAEALKRIHEHPGQYVLKAGHEVPALETVIDRIDDLFFVEKPTAPAS